MTTRTLVFAVLALVFPALTAPAIGQDTTTRPSAKRISKGTKHPFLWRVDSRKGEPLGATVWLYGTMHLGDKRLVMLPAVVEKAIESADALYFELTSDVVQSPKMQLMMMKRMLLPKGTTLSDKLPAPIYARLGAIVKKRGMSMEMLDRFKIWAVNLLLAQIEAQKAGFTHKLDSTVEKMARDDDKEVGSLETPEGQLEALAGLSDADQVAMMREGLTYTEKMDAEGKVAIGELLETYLRGDCDEMMRVANESMGADTALNERILKPLLITRNVGMVKGMTERIIANPKKSYFFAVGAMHYPGKGGVIELLEKQGYQITRMNPPPKKKPKSTKPTSKKNAPR